MADLTGEIFQRPNPSLIEVDGSGFNFVGDVFTPGSSGPVTTYYIQRVYSSGLSQWCMYTQTSENPTPLSGDTNPNWTGSITAHQVLGTYT